MNELALFAGCGGGILGGKLLGWSTVGAVEIEEYSRKVLFQRQCDGILPWFPIWDDIKTFDGIPWQGVVDIVSGGFPCQDISSAGKRVGITGQKSGLWKEMARVIYEVRPQFTFVENSPMLISQGLGTVLGDLAKMGYNARWCVLGAKEVGAPHKRDRIWILGWKKDMAYSNRNNWRGDESLQFIRKKLLQEETGDGSCSWWDTDPGADCCTISRGTAVEKRKVSSEPELGRMAYGVPNRMDRLKAIGNAQVPAVAALAFTILSEGLIYK